MQLVLSLSPGGTERLVIEICRQLAGRVECTVCCLDEPGAWASEVEQLGVPVVPLGREPGFHPTLALRLARILAERHIDVVHCHHYSPFVYGLLATLLRPQVRLVFTEHGRLSNDGPSRKRRLVNPVLARWPGRLCAVSTDLKDHMVAEGFPSRRVHVLHNGIDPGLRPRVRDRRAARAAFGLPADAFVVGTVGRLDPVKNLAAMLQAHALIVPRHPSARLVIVGEGPERRALEARARDLGIAESVCFAGHRADVRALMPAFDVYVNCSVYEGVSLTILEAMAATLPVVATPVGGNPEVVIDHETGRLVASHPRALATAVLALARDPARRRTLGEAGRWRVKRHFSLQRMVEHYADAYLAPRANWNAAEPATAPAICQARAASPTGCDPIAS
jgi:L-malate glycosyltransferase